MTMRVTELMRFNTMHSDLTSVQLHYAEILEKMASQRNINKISDDPSGVAMIMNYKKEQSALSGYQRAIENAGAWIAVTESQLTSANDILVKAREVAMQYGTDTATAETRLYGAEQVSQLIDQLQSVANYQYADRYLFSGTETATTPFTAQPAPEPHMGDSYQARDNVFQGAVEVTGAYAGQENRTYAVRMLEDNHYTLSSDGGRTWGDPQLLDIAIQNRSDEVPVTAGALIRDIDGYDHQAGDYIALGGLDSNGNPVDETFVIDADTTIGGLLTQMESIYGDVTASVTADGRLQVVDNGTENMLSVEIGLFQADDEPLETLAFATGPVLGTRSSVTLDSGITMELSDIEQAPAAGDIFYVGAFTSGYYRGNTEALSVEISKGVTFEYSITGNSVFSPDGGVDIFSVMTGLKEALENNDGKAIRGSIDGLRQSAVQVNTAIATCGTRMNRLEITKNNLTDLDFKLTELVSTREDVDISSLVTDFAMQEIVLKATYSMAAQMGTVTLMDFLR